MLEALNCEFEFFIYFMMMFERKERWYSCNQLCEGRFCLCSHNL